MTKFALKYIETCALPFCRRQIPRKGIDKQDLKLNLFTLEHSIVVVTLGQCVGWKKCVVSET